MFPFIWRLAFLRCHGVLAEDFLHLHKVLYMATNRCLEALYVYGSLPFVAFIYCCITNHLKMQWLKTWFISLMVVWIRTSGRAQQVLSLWPTQHHLGQIALRDLPSKWLPPSWAWYLVLSLYTQYLIYYGLVTWPGLLTTSWSQCVLFLKWWLDSKKQKLSGHLNIMPGAGMAWLVLYSIGLSSHRAHPDSGEIRGRVQALRGFRKTTL